MISAKKGLVKASPFFILYKLFRVLSVILVIYTILSKGEAQPWFARKNMGKINGIEIVNHSLFEGHDDADGKPSYHKADIYMDGKKVGSWMQDPWCGPDKYEFQDNKTEKEVIKRSEHYYNKNPDCAWHLISLAEFLDGKKPASLCYEGKIALTHLVWEILHLNEDEKKYKIHFNETGNDVLSITNFYQIIAPIPCAGHPCGYAEGHIFSVKKEEEFIIDEYEKGLKQTYPYGYCKRYYSLRDFNINTYDVKREL